MDSGVGYRHAGTVHVYENGRFVGDADRDAAVEYEERFLTTRTVHEDVAARTRGRS